MIDSLAFSRQNTILMRITDGGKRKTTHALCVLAPHKTLLDNTSRTMGRRNTAKTGDVALYKSRDNTEEVVKKVDDNDNTYDEVDR
jgi:hypothetical protein